MRTLANANKKGFRSKIKNYFDGFVIYLAKSS